MKRINRNSAIFERLDRALINSDGLSIKASALLALLENLPIIRSDHAPILLTTSHTQTNIAIPSFKFEAKWLLNSGFLQFS